MKRCYRAGVTLIEVVVAMVVLTTGLLALAGSAAVTIRRMAETSRGVSAASVGRSRAESSFALPCVALGSGSETVFGVRSEWSVTRSSAAADITQRITYSTRRGDHADDFMTAVPCE